MELVDLHECASWVSEDCFDALMLEGFDEDVGSLAGLVGSESGDESCILGGFFMRGICDVDVLVENSGAGEKMTAMVGGFLGL